MTDRKIFSIDRIEGELAVCISDDDEQLTVPISSLGAFEVRDVFSAVYDGNALTDITPMPEERDRRLAENRARLRAIARRSKK